MLLVASAPAGTVRGALTISAYLLGALFGWLASRSTGRVRRLWPVLLRSQVAASASLLGLFAAWRLPTPGKFLAPLAIEVAALFTLLVAYLSRGRSSPGEVSLESWSASVNGGFWVTPLAGMFGGASAVAIAALADRLSALRSAGLIHLLRRDAPLPQRHRTSWVDHSPLLALLLGLSLHLYGPAPAWSAGMLSACGLLLAFTGAALFLGSVLHPHSREVERTGPGTRRWLSLILARSLVLLPVAVLFWGSPLSVVAVLCALGAPAFNPPQLSVCTATALLRWLPRSATAGSSPFSVSSSPYCSRLHWMAVDGSGCLSSV